MLARRYLVVFSVDGVKATESVTATSRADAMAQVREMHEVQATHLEVFFAVVEPEADAGVSAEGDLPAIEDAQGQQASSGEGQECAAPSRERAGPPDVKEPGTKRGSRVSGARFSL